MSFSNQIKEGTLNERQIGNASAFICFFGGFSFLVVVADFPPPLKFVLLIPILILLSYLYYHYGRKLFKRINTAQPKIYASFLIFCRVFLEGICFGTALGLLFNLLPNGEPSLSTVLTFSNRAAAVVAFAILFGFCNLIECCIIYLLLLNSKKTGFK